MKIQQHYDTLYHQQLHIAHCHTPEDRNLQQHCCHNLRPRYFYVGFHLLIKHYNIVTDNAIKSITSNCNLLFQARNILGLNLGNR